MAVAGGRSGVVMKTTTGDGHGRRNARAVVEAKLGDGPSRRNARAVVVVGAKIGDGPSRQNVGTVMGDASDHGRMVLGGCGDIFRVLVVVVMSVVGRSGHAHVDMDVFGGCTTACVIANEGTAMVAHVLQNGVNHHPATGYGLGPRLGPRRVLVPVPVLAPEPVTSWEWKGVVASEQTSLLEGTDALGERNL
jgi:hypothetical protein